MSALEILIRLLKISEGCRLNSYQDVGGVWTIGYGQTLGITEDMIWTQQQADDDLLATALKVLEQALGASPVLIDATIQRQAAIADFIYNVGFGAYKKSTLKTKVDEKDWVGAASEVKRWNKVDGKPMRGLTVRRLKEANLLLNGVSF